MITINGKHYFDHIIKSPHTKGEFNADFILNSYEKAIKESGGIKIYSGNFSRKLNEITDESGNLVIELSSDSAKYHQFLIRKQEGNIWIELEPEADRVNYSVVFEGELREPAQIIQAERLRKALDQYGKVILYINFIPKNAGLKPDGVKAVDEIAKLMNLDRSLRLSIEGHTDNVGSVEFCRKLAHERVKSVTNRLQQLNIESYRLKTASYGSERPVETNDTEENRMKNRRIELIKSNVVDARRIKEEIEQNGKAILHIRFDSGKSTFSPEGMEAVDEIAILMQEDKELKLSIEGHTDNVGSFDLNRELSVARARAVVKRLETLNISGKRLRASGYGSERPLVPNTTESNKAKNRRVEIVKIR